MIFDAVRVGKIFQFQKLVGRKTKTLLSFYFLKVALHLGSCAQACKARENAVSNGCPHSISCWKTLNKINMSSSFELLKCNHGLHSDIEPSMKEVKFNDGSIHAVKLEGKSKDCESSVSVHLTPEIERKYVHCVYDAIAPHFSSTRFAKWPKVACFLNSLERDSVILDAGCGNGKYLGLNPCCFYIGCDISAPLINICAERGFEVMVADAVNLPYRTGFGDAAISIAVLHHLSTESRRRKAVEELVRVVRPGGLVLITVWAVEQEDRSLLSKWMPLLHKYNEEWVGPGNPLVRSSPLATTLDSIPETDVSESMGVHNQNPLKDLEELSEEKSDTAPVSSGGCDSENHQEYFVPWHLPYHRAEITGASASALANGFAKKDDKKGAVVYNRYYHVFIKGELERLVAGIQNAVISDQFYDKSNWCIILQKT